MKVLVTILAFAAVFLTPMESIAAMRARQIKGCFLQHRYNEALASGKAGKAAYSSAIVPCSSKEAIAVKQLEDSIEWKGATVSRPDCSGLILKANKGKCEMTVSLDDATVKMFAIPDMALKITEGGIFNLYVFGTEILVIDQAKEGSDEVERIAAKFPFY